MSDLKQFRILFVFPHPDDESFLTGGTIATYAHRADTRVYLYTLTRGEASRNATKLGISREEIAQRRTGEVREASRILGITELIQGAFPDGGLRDLDPRVLEHDFNGILERIDPDVVVTYDVQGSSVHPDHIVTHHVLKRVYLERKERLGRPLRLAFCGLPADATAHWTRKVYGFPASRIHASIDVSAELETERAAIRAHESVRSDVEEYNYDDWMLWEHEHYSFFGESFQPPVSDLLHGLCPATQEKDVQEGG
jgi:LmbE family N-acetylglucosaminyl deacetylase